MITLDKYLGTAKAARSFSSDRQLAEALGLNATAVNGWRKRRAWPSDDSAVKVAELAGLDPEAALIDLNIWRAKTPEVRETYTLLRDRLFPDVKQKLPPIALREVALIDLNIWRAKGPKVQEAYTRLRHRLAQVAKENLHEVG